MARGGEAGARPGHKVLGVLIGAVGCDSCHSRVLRAVLQSANDCPQ